jgi:hypothetical protein
MGLAGMYGSHLAIPVSRSQGLNSFVGSARHIFFATGGMT